MLFYTTETNLKIEIIHKYWKEKHVDDYANDDICYD